MNNVTIRKTLKECKISQWRLADALGISENTLVRRMRYELDEPADAQILKVIHDIKRSEESVVKIE